MRNAPIVIAGLVVAACTPADRVAAPAADVLRPALAVAPSVETFQIGMRLRVSVCAVPTAVVEIPLEGTVQWVVRTVRIGDRLSYDVHTNLQGLKGTLPDGSSVIAVGSANTVYNTFDVSDPSAPYTSSLVNVLYLVRPGTGIVYGAQYLYKVTITPNGEVTVNLESVDTGLPNCV